jgi:two-component system, NtrC family, sensor kinase
LEKEKTGFFENEQELLLSAFSTLTAQTVNACYIKSGGSQECWEHVAVPVQNGPGGKITIIRICRDITDKRHAEMELRSLNETLERRVNEEISKRKEGEKIAEQQSRLAALGELATGMAHEITQPLHTVLFSVENIRSRFDSGKLDATYLHDKIKSVESDIDRVRRVIDHMRLFARGAPDNFPVAFTVNRCVENAMSMIGVQLATHGIDTFLDLADPLPNMTGNPFQYEQVVLNLLSNARDAIEERLIRDAESDASDSVPGKIWISSAVEGKKIILTIEDNGSGVPEGMESKVFDPFFTTKASGKGTGLGLSISYGIIREMGGIITLERLQKLGTRVRITTPLSTGTELNETT